jgi:UNC-50 family
MVFMVGVDFALVGLVIATSAWLLARRFLKGGRRTVGVSADVIAGLGTEELEFGYCFDVHCNAFFPVFVWLYVVQYVVMPLLMRDLWYHPKTRASMLTGVGLVCFWGIRCMPLHSYITHTSPFWDIIVPPPSF